MKKLIYLFALSIAISSCMKSEKNGDDKTAYNSKRMADFYEKVMNAHDPSMVDSFCTPDFKDHQAQPGQGPGSEGLKASFKDFFTAFPDLNFRVNWVKSFGDTCIAHFTMTGTNSGPFMGRPAMNKKIEVDGIDIVTIKDGKATEHWGYSEDEKMMAQLGMMPPPAGMDSSAMSHK